LKGLTFIETLLFYFVFVYYFDFSFLNFLFLQDGLIDWSKPIVWQVPKLGDKYFNWVHVPVDTHMRLFQSDFVEYFSQCAETGCVGRVLVHCFCPGAYNALKTALLSGLYIQV
jgi:hypothetical protein